jgi:Lrp/AsnC family leucine-responsive transcriptional regulator
MSAKTKNDGANVLQDQLDAIDVHILQELQAHGRLTNLELADRVGLSSSPCLRRLRRLEEEGWIEGYSAKINQRKIGLGVTAFVSVNIERHQNTDAEAFMKSISKLPEVIASYIISGQSDFLLLVVVRDLDAYREFTLEKLLKVPGVKDIRSAFAIGTVKPLSPLPLQQLL